DVRQNPIFFNKSRKIHSDELLFIEREKIKSAAGILLMADEEIVGTMFVNYRRIHFFSDNEKEFIDTIASSAALAIKNQRSIQDRQDELMTMAHDFKGSLMPILTSLDRVRRKDDDGLSVDTRYCINYAISFAENLSIISLSTYRWLSHQAGLPVSNQIEHFNAQVEIEKLTNLLQFANERCDLKFEIKKDKDFPKVLINKDIITVVLLGLLENAVKYANDDTIVVITLNYKKNEQGIEIRIKSMGKSIDPCESKKIFEKFERSQVVGGRSKQGTGIGLWAMRKLIRSVGGNLYLDKAKLPKTAEFIVEIPKIFESPGKLRV
ncbi:MAG: GAF domain-containing sensor histidine kinase, partial [Candidatus Heimdallarchaeota archaeon]|nr:GAF domain-containing sensor histidine kinase [Candidatus Heimdallarchaeota archaeon]